MVNVLAMDQTNHSRRLATELRAELARRRLAGAQLARDTGIPQQTMSRKLNGQSEFTFDDVVSIARALDIALADLIGMAAIDGSAA